MENKEYIERGALYEKVKSLTGVFTDDGFMVDLQAVLNAIDFEPACYVAEVLQCQMENKTLTVEDLRALPLNEWVWIEVPYPFAAGEKVSAYYRKQEDYTHDRAFCCGYPGISFSFDYAKYNKMWTAYTYQPKGV